MYYKLFYYFMFCITVIFFITLIFNFTWYIALLVIGLIVIALAFQPVTINPIIVSNHDLQNDKLLELFSQSNVEPHDLLVPTNMFETTDIHIDSEDIVKEKANIIINTLAKFKINAEFVKFTANATLTTIMLKGNDFVEKDTGKIHPFDSSKINYYLENIKLNLSTGLVTFVPIVEGESLFAFEIRSNKNNVIRMGNALQHLNPDPFELNFVVGQQTDGDWLITNMIKHPHSLIVGTTDSGKSTFANAMICQLLAQKTSDELELWISDNKVVEFAAYETLPHTKYFARTYEDTIKMLDKLIDIEKYRSNNLFTTVRAKNIVAYNRKVTPDKRLPFIIVIIDEFPALIEVDKKTRSNPFMSNLNILLSKARAAGIYINILSQNAKATIIDTALRANLPCRIVFTVADQNDSNTAGVKGAELLNGNGDLIFKLYQNQERAQAPFISDLEIDSLVEFILNDYQN